MNISKSALQNPSALANHLQKRIALLHQLEQGLRGHSFDWGNSAGAVWRKQLKDEFGIELVTETGAAKAGHRIKKRAQPVGRMYFKAPISKYADLYVLNVQTEPK